MDKRFWICGLTLSASALLLGFLVHGVLLRADYLALAHLFRPREDADANVGWILLAYLSLGLAMTWLYRWLPPPVRSKRWHGARFGLALALVSFVPWHLLAHAGQPFPLGLTLRQVVFDVIAMQLLGLLLAWLQPHRRVLAPAPDERGLR
ncbi:hypothetical protein MNO14_12135 [Luteimonas sp. S4-F44]|uniref:hypothetical protein n=1 Tax=Luteimonas sp. S4-F44 TaxID=2925842 RepID=UPI001F5377A7|nr:hypothetical protein [Luteimonas sp. S4-F44]UNK41704.1 hypothetical protein MNO14_12135 [Luteimonas sp. S4-F44]